MRIFELAVEIFPVFSMSDLDMHDEALGDELNLFAQSFDEHAVMANPLIHVVEPTIKPFESRLMASKPLLNSIESPIMTIKPLLDGIEPPIVSVEPLLNPAKPLIKVLNEFLIHTASAVM